MSFKWNPYSGSISIFLFFVTAEEIDVIVVVVSGRLGRCGLGGSGGSSRGSAGLAFQAGHALLEGEDQVAEVLGD